MEHIYETIKKSTSIRNLVEKRIEMLRKKLKAEYLELDEQQEYLTLIDIKNADTN